MKTKYLLIILTIIICSCSSDENQKNQQSNESSTPIEKTQLNISILLDLSDRLVQQMEPPQDKRDIEIVKSILSVFKKKMEADGAFRSKSKIRVLFDPPPSDPNVNNIASQLSVDLSTLDNKQKKDIFNNIENDFEENLKEIYKMTIETEDWIGSDIWRFFKYSVNELCIDNDPQYRNILIIITDGYIYHKQSTDREQNRTTYVTGPLLEREELRTSNWREKFDSEEYGLISFEHNLSNLEVMVLEINSSTSHKNDEDIIRAFIGKWFDEMGIENKVIYNTDLPQNTKKRIENFFK